MKCFESRVYARKGDKFVRQPSVYIANAPSIEVIREQLKFSAAFFSTTYPEGFIFITTEAGK